VSASCEQPETFRPECEIRVADPARGRAVRRLRRVTTRCVRGPASHPESAVLNSRTAACPLTLPSREPWG